MTLPVRYFERFSLAQRLEHLLALGSFTVLAVTGLPQEFATAGWAQVVIGWLGGIEMVRSIHHLAALVLLLEVVAHLVGAGYRLYVLRARPSMLPGRDDLREARGTLLYNLGRQPARPQGGRYTFEEKVEYWAFVWGTIVMGLTGFIMLNPIVTTHFLPGEIVPAAKIVHGYEAVLAVLAILIWHLYAVHLRHFNQSMWTGKLSEPEMLAEHPLELAELQAGATQPAAAASDQKKRRRVYYPLATVTTVGLLVGVFAFMGLEKTAIDTVSPRLKAEAQMPVYAPLTPTPLPFPTPLPIPSNLKPVWQGNVALVFARSCTVCHGGIAGLDYTTYQSTLKGGQDGPVIVPGDAAGSLTIRKISDGTHPGPLSPTELSVLKAWIAAGAVEK
jgi:cytochrome b subunit of formate dehydrogenase